MQRFQWCRNTSITYQWSISTVAAKLSCVLSCWTQVKQATAITSFLPLLLHLQVWFCQPSLDQGLNPSSQSCSMRGVQPRKGLCRDLDQVKCGTVIEPRLQTAQQCSQKQNHVCAQSSSSPVPKLLLLALADFSCGSQIQDVSCRQREFAVSTGLAESFLISSCSVCTPN